MKKIKKAIAALLSTTCLMSNMASMSTTAAYRPNDAVLYAYTFCGCYRRSGSAVYYHGYNSKYIAQSQDCTNFVSQCMYAGGVKMEGQNSFSNNIISVVKKGCIDTNEKHWFYIDNSDNNNKDAYSSTWTIVAKNSGPYSGLKDYLTVDGGENSSYIRKDIHHTGKNVYNVVRVGDIIQFSHNKGKDYNHSAIVTKKDANDFYYTAHTINNVDKAGSSIADQDIYISVYTPR